MSVKCIALSRRELAPRGRARLTIDKVQGLGSILPQAGLHWVAALLRLTTESDVAGQVWNSLVHVKVEELSVGEERKVIIKVAKVLLLLLGGSFGGRGDGVEVGTVLRHIGRPTGIVRRHGEDNPQVLRATTGL